jgi:uncharacterized damage-inducible protein DinB
VDEKALFLKFWEREAPATRKVISRIPEDKSDYKPEPKSRNAREIAWLIVMEEKVLVEGLEKGTIQWKEFPAPATVAEILATYDQNHEDVTKRLYGVDSSVWEKEFRFMYGDYEISKGTGFHFGWEFLFDSVHHRGQLSTYLRPMGSTVPSIYGPSADENG